MSPRHTRIAVENRSFSAPRQLAASTDLKPESVRAVADVVNPLIADAFTL